MLPELHAISNLLHVSDQIYERAFEGVSDDLARQPMDRGNRFLWVAAHMVVPRGWLARILGDSVDVPWEQAFNRGAEPPAEGAEWPTSAAVLAKWREVSSLIYQRLDTLTPADLAKPIQNFPSTDGTLMGGLTLMPFHDAYHLGQLGHLRRRLDLPRLVG